MLMREGTTFSRRDLTSRAITVPSNSHSRMAWVVGWVLLLALFVDCTPARSLPSSEQDGESCMVGWLRLQSGIQTVEAARTVEKRFHSFATPVDESNTDNVDLWQLSVSLNGDQQAQKFMSCLSGKTEQCRLSAPCRNGGQCLFTRNTLMSAYQCSCPQGFSGKYCQTEISPCSRSPCKNGGCCQTNGTAYICQCPPLHTGDQCQTRWWSEEKLSGIGDAMTVLARELENVKEDARKLRDDDRQHMETFLVRLEQRLSRTLNTRLVGMETKIADLTSRINNTDASVNHLISYECQRSDRGLSGVFFGMLTTGYTAFCDRNTDDGGWTVIQRRRDGSVNFERNWEEYKRGFGSASGEYWLGLETIHQLTSQPGHPFELRFDMTFADDGTKHVAKYSHFAVGPESGNYRLNVSGFSSLLSNSMDYHNNMMFSTKDRDNDGYGGDCSQVYKGGWWYNGCYHVNINGRYGLPTGNRKGATWYSQRRHNALNFVEMKIRPRHM